MTENKVRAEILETGNPKIKSARIIVHAKPSLVFSILNNPKKHIEIDGSETIQASVSGPDELVLGSKFGMKMHLVIDYRILNIVVEYK